jgi:hypothetical protein
MTRRAVPGLNWLPRTSLSGSGTPVQRERGEANVPLMSITRRTGASSSVVSYVGWPEVTTVTRDGRGALLDLDVSELAGRAESVRRLCGGATGSPQGHNNKETAQESHGTPSSFLAC